MNNAPYLVLLHLARWLSYDDVLALLHALPARKKLIDDANFWAHLLQSPAGDVVILQHEYRTRGPLDILVADDHGNLILAKNDLPSVLHPATSHHVQWYHDVIATDFRRVTTTSTMLIMEKDDNTLSFISSDIDPDEVYDLPIGPVRHYSVYDYDDYPTIVPPDEMGIIVYIDMNYNLHLATFHVDINDNVVVQEEDISHLTTARQALAAVLTVSCGDPLLSYIALDGILVSPLVGVRCYAKELYKDDIQQDRLWIKATVHTQA